jgi:hypothetical protein
MQGSWVKSNIKNAMNLNKHNKLIKLLFEKKVLFCKNIDTEVRIQKDKFLFSNPYIIVEDCLTAMIDNCSNDWCIK